MKSRSLQWLVLLAICFLCTEAPAQTNELSFAVGAYTTSHVHLKNDQMFALQGAVAHRFLNLHKASLLVELPIAASFDNRAKATAILQGQFFATRHYAAIFIAPGVQLKLFPDSRISPYFMIGAGLAHFSKTGGSSSTNTNVVDFGGGIDVRLTHRFALRSEVRDFYSGPPQLITGLLDREHQIIATGGVVFRF